MTFDIDCGEVVPGHRLVARGLGRGGVTDWSEWGITVPATGFSFEYEFVPGIPAAEQDNFFDYLFDLEYHPDVDLGAAPPDGGALAPFEGGPAPHGSRGEWPLPDGAVDLRFDIASAQGVPLGGLRVDLAARTAAWTPADDTQATAEPPPTDS